MRKLTLFESALLIGLAIASLALCLLIGYALIIVANEPLGTQTPEPNLLLIASPTAETFLSPTDLAAPQPTLELPPTIEQIPTPQPAFNDTPPPAGKIAFTCYVNQIDQICLLNADGSGRAQLTNLKATAFYPSVSPDGQTIYFSSRDSGNYEIYSIDIFGNNLQKLTNGIGALYAPELSPNGEWIVFTKNGDGLWKMRPDGSDVKRITNRDDIDPSWSPDGAMISFASSRAGARQLFVMNADGSNIRQVTDLTNMGGRNTWSPDGTRLAFYRGEQGNRNIYIINVDGAGLVKLTDGGDNLGPSWSPDGNWIVFTSFRDGNNELYIIHPDGTGLMRLTNSPISDWQPRWGK
ncbi:MAG: PD40 domain-containing protein [Chloroflexi bacterium]|nr:PD40 domain-containing protein [Chloroflexota bacterium]